MRLYKITFRSHRIFGILLLLASLFFLYSCTPKTKSRRTSCGGIYQSGSGATLARGWKYYITRGKQARLPFTQPEFDDSRWKTLKGFPFEFRDLKIKNYKAGTTVWLRCHLELQGRAPDGMSLSLGTIHFSDQVWLNGTSIGKTGSPDQDLSDIEKFRVYSLPGHLWQEGPNLITIRIRGITYRAQMQGTPRIQKEQPLQRHLILKDTPQIIFSNIYILVSAFFGLFFVFFWRQKENLFFALFCLSLGFYNLIRTHYRYDLFDSFEESYRVELLLLFSLPLLFSEYYHHLIRIKRHLLFKILYGIYALLIVITILRGNAAKNWYYLINFNLVLIVVSVGALIHSFVKEYQTHQRHLRFILYGFMFLVPTVVMDILATLNLHSLPRLTVYGFFFFLAAISLQLSNSILDLYQQIEVQERELRSLEKKRTRSLFNLSNEFNTILDGLKEGLPNPNEKKQPARHKKAGKKTSLQISKKGLQNIEHSVLNLENIVRDSSLLVLLENHEYNQRRIPVAMEKLCKDTISKAVLSTKQSPKRVRLLWNADIKEIQGDPDLISTALYHLLENALLYSLGTIDLQAIYEPDGHLLLSIRDEGPGIAPEKLDLVVQKFTRANEENQVAGSGIGLTIVNLIMQDLGGTLTLDSGQGFYCEARLHFPVEVIS